jgi:hypothetical protein
MSQLPVDAPLNPAHAAPILTAATLDVAPRLLVNFNLRFNMGARGLSDRIAPLIGMEWAF